MIIVDHRISYNTSQGFLCRGNCLHLFIPKSVITLIILSVGLSRACTCERYNLIPSNFRSNASAEGNISLVSTHNPL